jgi:hypothetical protein
VPHAEFAAELVSLPSGLLAMVCEAIVKLKVRLGLLVPAFRLHGRWQRADEGRRMHGACQSIGDRARH